MVSAACDGNSVVRWDKFCTELPSLFAVWGMPLLFSAVTLSSLLFYIKYFYVLYKYRCSLLYFCFQYLTICWSNVCCAVMNLMSTTHHNIITTLTNQPISEQYNIDLLLTCKCYVTSEMQWWNWCWWNWCGWDKRWAQKKSRSSGA